MKTKKAISVFVLLLILFPAVSFGAKEVPSENSQGDNSSVQQEKTESEMEQNINSGESQGQEKESEQNSNAPVPTGLGDNTTDLMMGNPEESKNQNETGNSNQMDNQSQSGVQSETQIQNQTNNEGEDKQISVQEENGDEADSGEFGVNRISRFVDAMLEIETIAEQNGETGVQIKNLLEQQNQQQSNIEGSLASVQSRNTFLKMLIGVDYSKVNDIQQRLEQQNNHIQEMISYANQLQNEGDYQIVMKQVEIMQGVAEEIKQELDQEQNSWSVFGWLFKMFA